MVLKNPRILVTNDDGIHAPGLAVAEAIAHELSDDVWVVAPENEQSGASHSLSLSSPMRARAVGERRFAVDGTPTDCVLMAFQTLVEDRPPDVVLSGVNRGQNLADDVSYSGTVAGAKEGALLGAHAIAFSQTLMGGLPFKWETARAWGAKVARAVLAGGAGGAQAFVNVNFPDRAPDKVRGVVAVRQGKRDQSLLKLVERHDPRGRPYYWIGFERHPSNPPAGTDLRAVYDGWIAVTPLVLDYTRHDALGALGDALAEAGL